MTQNMLGDLYKLQYAVMYTYSVTVLEVFSSIFTVKDIVNINIYFNKQCLELCWTEDRS